MVVVLVAALLLWVNTALHRVPRPGSPAEDAHTLALLQALRPDMHGDIPRNMQALFPEGAPFAYALYGLAWCELQPRLQHEQQEQALQEARWALERLGDDAVTSRFPSDLEPAFGVFHAGWSAYLHGKLIETSAALNEEDLQLFAERCAAIEEALAQSASPFLESYGGQAWPADVTVAMAALALHDRLLPARHTETLAAWVRETRLRLDTQGMLPHAWDPLFDDLRTPARGSSMALMNVFLPDVDAALATEQYALFQRHFYTERFGLPAVREHPHGTSGAGDIDSGPLIMGICPAATIVAAGAARRNGDVLHALEFASTVDAWGFITGGERPRYLFGVLSIADLFIAWCRAMPPNVSAELHQAPRFLRFHGWSALLLALLALPELLLRRRAARDQ